MKPFCIFAPDSILEVKRELVTSTYSNKINLRAWAAYVSPLVSSVWAAPFSFMRHNLRGCIRTYRHAETLNKNTDSPDDSTRAQFLALFSCNQRRAT